MICGKLQRLAGYGKHEFNVFIYHHKKEHTSLALGLNLSDQILKQFVMRIPMITAWKSILNLVRLQNLAAKKCTIIK
jgi:hypothetical protein